MVTAKIYVGISALICFELTVIGYGSTKMEYQHMPNIYALNILIERYEKITNQLGYPKITHDKCCDECIFLSLRCEALLA